MLASSFFDPVLGVDIHFEMVPMPAPVPTPIPNPFTGMVFDPMGLAMGLAIGAAMSLVTGGPLLGPVMYWTAFPATNTGTEAVHIPGHILIPPGVAWAPFPKTPKPVIRKGAKPKPAAPIKPENDAIVIFGSKTVMVMGTNAVRLGDIALSCSEPLRLPSSVVLAVPKGAPILIGGPPSLDLMSAIMGSLRTRFVSDSLHALLSRLKPSRMRNLLHKGVCFLTGHPVDVATGKVMTEFVDAELPGPLPLKIERTYSSAFAARPGSLGYGWSLSVDQSLWRERGKIVLLAEDGREIEFDTFDFADHRIVAGQEVYNPIEGLTLRCEAEEVWSLVDHEGRCRVFAPVSGRNDGRAMIQLIRSSCGYHEIAFHYDERGRLEWLRDSCGRRVELRHDVLGRVIELRLPRPEGEGHERHRRYFYDDAGDLVEVADALDQRWRCAYVTHLLTQETDRNGLSFHFAYDGVGEDAWCVRTWGDEGILDHVLSYDKAKHVTYVTNSLGHTTQYHMNVVGQVVKGVDPLGGETSFEYDPITLMRTSENDALGQATSFRYDACGNMIELVEPDGARTQLAYGVGNQLTRVKGPDGGEWTWRYDQRGRLIEELGCDGHSTTYFYGIGFLTRITDAAGRHTDFGYDRDGMLNASRGMDGASRTWCYDGLGRSVAVTDPLGNRRTRRFDRLGRVFETHEADGNVRTLRHDPEGNVIHAIDAYNDVRLTYAGMSRVASRTQSGATVRFVHNTEGQLTTIVNEDGRTYSFEFDARGDLALESGFDDLRRGYLRDAIGQVTEVQRPANRFSTYRYDPAGRVVAVKHSDGSGESFEYRLDGHLMVARNDDLTVRFERDALGRVIREWQGEHWVQSIFDWAGERVALRSSFGAVHEIERDDLGDVVGMRYGQAESRSSNSSLPRFTWEVRIERDLMGHEIGRRLPGGAHARWIRDKLGRPLRHQLRNERALQRDVGYRWSVDDRLLGMVNAVHGIETSYGHEAPEKLVWAQHGDGTFDLRMPDAVGNLFRREDRSDREYGPAGQLLAEATADGVCRYAYDPEGNLVEKREPEGGVWRYDWSAAGDLISVERPDGRAVTFVYDALGRRVSKTFDGETTRWVWDGDVPLHEWVKYQDEDEFAQGQLGPLDEGSEVATRQRDGMLSGRPSRGPPTESELKPRPTGLITWLFDPESFAPAAKIVGGECYSIVTDHLGAPVAMLDGGGRKVWSAEFDVYGRVRRLETTTGYDRFACPFRWPGQYEDAETGLYYNRFRYYDPDSGVYTSADPLGLEGGRALYAYPHDPLSYGDPLGLVKQTGAAWAKNAGARTHVTYRAMKNGKFYTGYASAPTKMGLSAKQIVARRYGGNFKNFNANPRVVYTGKGVKGKQAARGLEHHYFEQDVKKHGRTKVANAQRPVGPKNPRGGDYRKAADDHLKKSCK